MYSVCIVGYIIALRILKYNIGYSNSYVEWHTKKYLFYENNSKIKIRLSKLLFKFFIFNIKLNFFCQNIGIWHVYPEDFDCLVGNVKSEIWLDSPISKKVQKPLKLNHFEDIAKFWAFSWNGWVQSNNSANLPFKVLWIDTTHAHVLTQNIFHFSI